MLVINGSDVAVKNINFINKLSINLPNGTNMTIIPTVIIIENINQIKNKLLNVLLSISFRVDIFL